MSLQTKSFKTEQKNTITTLLALMIFAITGCGSLTPTVAPMALLETQPQPQISFESAVTRELDNDELIENRRTDAEPVKISRRMGTVSSGATLVAETILVDPLIRPVSTASALFSLSVKSVGGFLKRNTINAISFRVMENTPIPALSYAPAMDLTTWEKDLDEIVRNKASMGSIDYLVDGEEYFARLIESIASAEQEIDLRTYIFDNDDVGVKIADLLKSKSEKLDVRILVDGLGDLFATNLDSESMPEDFELPGSISSYLEQDSNVRVRKQSNPWLTGDHVKTTIIDQKLAFIGGMNIGREYRYDWHDLMMAVEGPIVKQLRFEFDKAWDKSSFIGDLGWLGRNMQGYDKEMDGEGYPIRVLSTNIHNSEIYRAQVEAIRRARSYIYIENAYFSDDTVLYELARARRRGVDVRVIMPSSNDSGTMDLSNDVAINRMLRNGIRVYAYPGMTHVKAAVYDGWACLGSANFDKLSLQINKEINLGTSHPEAVNRLLNRVFIPDFAKATELHEAKPIRWTHHLAEFISDEML
jgi:cardiolipin synthase